MAFRSYWNQKIDAFFMKNELPAWATDVSQDLK
jgi:hypothetical protein